MVDRPRTVWKVKTGGVGEKTAEFGEVEISNADTVTFGSLDSAQNPLKVYFVKKSDGTEMTCTYVAGTNVVTISGAGNNIDCIYVAYGYKA